MLEKENNGSEFLKKFGYRSYSGEKTGRMARVTSIIDFEVRSTWSKSTWGKVLLIIVSIMNFFTILFAATVSSFTGVSNRNALNEFIANYIAFGDANISSNTNPDVFIFNPGIIGLLLVSLFAIAGSGYFADDKNGHVVEIYLSRITKREYIMGKIGAILVYINIFLLGPLLITSALMVQSLGLSHFKLLPFYFKVIMFGFAYSLVIGLIMLTLSTFVEKRQYASLGFFVIYLLATIIGQVVAENNPNDQLLLLISPSSFLVLLAYVILGDNHLALRTTDAQNAQGNIFSKTPLVLNDGVGLEWYHVIGLFLFYILFFGTLLAYKIRKLTTEEL